MEKDNGTSSYTLSPFGRFSEIHEISSLVGQVDTVLESKTARLKFPDPLERFFERENRENRHGRWLLAGTAATIVYNLFLIADHFFVPDVFRASLVVRLCVVTPVGAFLAFFFRRKTSTVFQEGMSSLMVFLACLGKIFILTITRSPVSPYYHFGIPLIIVGTYLIMQPRFLFGLLTFSLVIIAYIAAEPFYVWGPPMVQVNNIIFIGMIFVIVVSSVYRLEKRERRGYLLTLRERIRSADLSAKNIELDSLSQRDPLTGLPNRRSLDLYLESFFAAAPPEDFSVILFDVDHFKAYNDTYGHPAGDTCLKNVAEHLRHSFRQSGDIVVRYGGEEFIAVLPGTPASAARSVAERARKRIEALGIVHEEGGLGGILTISGGLSSGRISSTAEFQDLVKLADAALYRAKAAGRNKIEQLL